MPLPENKLSILTERLLLRIWHVNLKIVIVTSNGIHPARYEVGSGYAASGE